MWYSDLTQQPVNRDHNIPVSLCGPVGVSYVRLSPGPLSPLRGSLYLHPGSQGLRPWATFCRPSGARHATRNTQHATRITRYSPLTTDHSLLATRYSLLATRYSRVDGEGGVAVLPVVWRGAFGPGPAKELGAGAEVGHGLV